VDERPSQYVRRARLEAIRVRELLSAALVDTGHADVAARTMVRPLLVVVGGRHFLVDDGITRLPEAFAAAQGSPV
jgi:hypothetical protein